MDCNNCITNAIQCPASYCTLPHKRDNQIREIEKGVLFKGKKVSALYLQGFYRKDLKDREIMIGRQTFSAAELESNIMYQDQNIVVYDLSNFLYRDTLGARVDATGLGEAFETEIAECLGQMDTLIVKGSSKEQEPVAQPQPLIADHIQL